MPAEIKVAGAGSHSVDLTSNGMYCPLDDTEVITITDTSFSPSKVFVVTNTSDVFSMTVDGVSVSLGSDNVPGTTFTWTSPDGSRTMYFTFGSLTVGGTGGNYLPNYFFTGTNASNTQVIDLGDTLVSDEQFVKDLSADGYVVKMLADTNTAFSDPFNTSADTTISASNIVTNIKAYYDKDGSNKGSTLEVYRNEDGAQYEFGLRAPVGACVNLAPRAISTSKLDYHWQETILNSLFGPTQMPVPGTNTTDTDAMDTSNTSSRGEIVWNALRQLGVLNQDGSAGDADSAVKRLIVKCRFIDNSQAAMNTGNDQARIDQATPAVGTNDAPSGGVGTNDDGLTGEVQDADDAPTEYVRAVRVFLDFQGLH
jgi:hypothetical protein